MLAQDGRVCDNAPAPASPAALLRSLPPGAYTVARTHGRTRVIDWQCAPRNAHASPLQHAHADAAPLRRRHVARLAQSLALLRAASAPDVNACAAAAELPATPDALEAAVTPTVRCALRAAQPLCGDGAGELLLTVHVALHAPTCVTAHVSPVPPVRTGAIAAYVCGAPRQHAVAKASSWVAARAPLEASRPSDCEETILSDPSTGALHEGCISNFFVVVEARSESAAETAEDDAALLARCELWTASLADGVLPGVARAGVLRAAAALRLRVVEAAPVAGADAAQRWREAFVCNAVRGVTPLRELRWPDAGPGARPPLRWRDAPGRVTRALAAALDAQSAAALSPDFG